MASKRKSDVSSETAGSAGFSHILVPVDGSRFSLRAVKTAVCLAQAFGSRVTIFFCAPDFLGHYASESPELREHYSSKKFREAVARHSRRVLEAAARHAGMEVRTHSNLGTKPYTGINQAARKLDCDLIVMASRATAGKHGVKPDSETQGVLTHTKLPVLVVH